MLLRNDGGLSLETAQNIAVTCYMQDVVVTGCQDAVAVKLPDGFGPVTTKFRARTPMGDAPLEMRFSIKDGPSATLEVDVPERILGVGRHVWECYGDLPGRMTRCGGWHLGLTSVIKWVPDRPIKTWATGRRDYLIELDRILQQISELMNHTFLMVESREQADLVIQAGVAPEAVAEACNGGTVGCGHRIRVGENSHSITKGEAHAVDMGDNIPRWLITHELMHALIPQGHYRMAYHTIREIENLSAGDEAILRLHAHPAVEPGMSAGEVEELIVFSDELLDASPLDVNTIAWRAREALIKEGSARFTARGRCLTSEGACVSHGVRDFGWTDYTIGEPRLPGNHFQHLSLNGGELEAYLAGKEFWIESPDRWRDMDWGDFSNATGWRPNYTSLLTVLENILLLAHDGDIEVVEMSDGTVVLDSRRNRGLRLFSGYRMGLSLSLNVETYHVSDYTVTICGYGESSECILEIQARDGEYGVELTVPETIRQSHRSPVRWKGLSSFSTLSSGLHHTCALREDGTPVCWGSSQSGEKSPPRGEVFKSISSGGSYTCGLRADGSAVCWGSDLGEDSHWRSRDGLWTAPADANRESGYNAKPVAIMRFTSLSTGQPDTCALRPDGSPFCWGWEDDAPYGEVFTAISTGEGFACALRTDGTPTCWGTDRYGRTTPPPGEQFASISSGALQVCALRRDGTPICWGNDDYGQASPPQGEQVISISTGGQHACGLRHDGSAVCWGRNGSGQASPPEDERFVSISGGGYHTCGLRPDGTAVCWGLDRYGQSSPPQDERFNVAHIGEK